MAASIRQPAVPDRSTLGDDSHRVSHPCCRTKLFKRGLRDDGARPRPLKPDSQPWKISDTLRSGRPDLAETNMYGPRAWTEATYSRRVNLTTAPKTHPIKSIRGTVELILSMVALSARSHSPAHLWRT